MSDAPFRVVALGVGHDRAAFHSGSLPLDRYLKEQVTQDMRRRMAACFVALTDEQRVVGFYTLASASLLLNGLPPHMIKKLPRYPTVPAVRLGRLAVDFSFKGQGLGGALLADALDRAVQSEIAAYALLVDARGPPPNDRGARGHVGGDTGFLTPGHTSLRGWAGSRFA